MQMQHDKDNADYTGSPKKTQHLFQKVSVEI